MRKIMKLVPIITLFVVTLLMILYKDMDIRSKYYAYKNLSYIGMNINEESAYTDDSTLTNLNDIAQKNNIYIVKQTYEQSTGKKKIFFSTDHIETILKEKYFNYEKITENEDNAFAATYMTEAAEQGYLIPDFLGNDEYELYKLTALKEHSSYPFGAFGIYYEQDENLNTFFYEASSLLQVPVDSLRNNHSGVLLGHTDVVMAAILGSLFISAILYFCVMLFNLYKNTKKIGCYQLLGFDTKAIVLQFIKQEMFSLLGASVFILITTILFSKNIDFPFIASLFFAHLFVLCMTVIIIYISVVTIKRSTQISNIVKSESVLKKVQNLCFSIKIIAIVLLLLFSVFLTPTLKETWKSSNIVKENDIVMDYAVFSKVGSDNNEYLKGEKYISFFQDLVDNERVSYIYVDFRNCLIDEGIEETVDILVGKMASVDVHYLEKENVEIFDKQGNVVDYHSITQEYLLFPKSKRDIVNPFIQKYQAKTEQLNKTYSLTPSDNYYFYDNRAFTTYDVMQGKLYVESPIIRVIDLHYPVSYFDKPVGLDIAGTGMSTALKFDISKGQQEVFNEINKSIKVAGMEMVLYESTFVSYEGYLSDQLAAFQNARFIGVSCISLILFFYIFVVFQTFILYVEANRKLVLVRVLLGHKKVHIFQYMFVFNLLITIIAVILTGAYVVSAGQIGFIVYALLSIGFIVIDACLSFVILQTVRLNDVYVKLKGN